MPFDAHANLCYTIIANPPAPADTGTGVTVRGGDGQFFPLPPFNATVWPYGVAPLRQNAEIVRVTAVNGDALTFLRAQEGTPARPIISGDQIALTLTAKTIADIEATTFLAVGGGNVVGPSGSIIDAVALYADTTGITLKDSAVKFSQIARRDQANVFVADLTVLGNLSVGTTPAASGVIRVPNNTGILARNAANSADLALIHSDGSNQVWLGDGAGATVVTGSVVYSLVPNTYMHGHLHADPDNASDIGSTSYRWRAGYFVASISVGTNPAVTGVLRLANAATVAWRNAANSNDVAMRVTATDRIDFSSGGAYPTGFDFVTASNTGLTVNAAGVVAITGTTASLAIGTNPSTVGAIRLGNNNYLTSRNVGNSADVGILQFFTDDKLYVGAGSGDQGLVLRSAVSVTVQAALTIFTGPVQLPAGNPVLKFGGATAAFPALRNTGAVLEAISADTPASVYVSFRAMNFVAMGGGNSLPDLTVTGVTALAGYHETAVNVGISGGGLTMNLASGSYFWFSHNQHINTTTIQTVPVSGRFGSFVVEITATGPAWTWPWFSSTVRWEVVPTLPSTAGKVGLYAFYTHDGGATWRGVVIGVY